MLLSRRIQVGLLGVIATEDAHRYNLLTPAVQFISDSCLSPFTVGYKDNIVSYYTLNEMLIYYI